MADYYRKVDDHTLSHDGKTYYKKEWVQKKIDILMDNTQRQQKRIHESDRLIMRISNHWFVRLFFAKKISNYIDDYENVKLKF